MQIDFNLQNIPNQSFTTTINNIDMEITLKLADENYPHLLFAIETNDGYLCPYIPIFANQGLLPYNYMIQELGGQFFIETEQDEYPDYTKFGDTQNLSFITLDELDRLSN